MPKNFAVWWESYGPREGKGNFLNARAPKTGIQAGSREEAIRQACKDLSVESKRKWIFCASHGGDLVYRDAYPFTEAEVEEMFYEKHPRPGEGYALLKEAEELLSKPPIKPKKNRIYVFISKLLKSVKNTFTIR